MVSRVSSGTDDAEESRDGGMYLDSSDLELVWEGRRGNQMVGMRFQNIPVPPGAAITKAYIQFKVGETDYHFLVNFNSSALFLQNNTTDHT